MTDEGAGRVIELGRLAGGVIALAERGEGGGWGMAVRGAGAVSCVQPQPIRIETYEGNDQVREHAGAYDAFDRDGDGWLGRGAVAVGSSSIAIEDRWRIVGEELRLERSVRVSGDAPGGFLSSAAFEVERPFAWVDVDAFVPGLLYGWSERITGEAIGGVTGYLTGVRQVRIREDRTPAPLAGFYLGDGTSIALLNPEPRGWTTAADAADTEAAALVDDRFRFGAVGGYERDGWVSLAYWFPGTEGEVTYSGTTFPGGQMRRWRRRYHPIRDGLSQHYHLAFRFGRDERFPDFSAAAWRWAWGKLQPMLVPQDIEAARRSLTEMLAATVVGTEDGRSGWPIAQDATTGQLPSVARARALMGFVGRNIESAYFLLRGAERETSETAATFRNKAYAVLESFARLPVSPPEAEGFRLDDGTPAVHIGDRIHLRVLAEGGKYMLRAWRWEHDRGRERPHWRAWCLGLGDWILGQQRENGALPRAVPMGGGKAEAPAAESTYEAVPFLVALAGATGDGRYLDAAIRAGEYCWAAGHFRGVFVGGTIDNPNVIDKEAGTLSLEAYLALFEATGDDRWLRRAKAAADFAETWIFIWDVPMPDGVDDAELAWKHGVSTVGLQLIATGHSLVDTYMAWDVAAYAKLARYTGDDHYLEVARLLLHNTKTMLALPGRTYDLLGPGWQQEHWSLAPRRGQGIHRLWLPWISCSHLEGIYELEGWDPEFFATLAAGRSAGAGGGAVAEAVAGYRLDLRP